MKITGIEPPIGGGTLWSGTASAGSKRHEWFATRNGLSFGFREEEPDVPGYWMNVDPPAGAKQFILKAIRAAQA